MKRIKIVLHGGGTRKKPNELFLEAIVAAVDSAYGGKMGFAEQRTLGKILDEIERSSEEHCEIRDEHYEFLREALKNAQLPVLSCKLVNDLYDNFGL